MSTPLHMPPDQVDSLVTVLDLVRRGTARTKPELVRISGLGRNLINERVSHLLSTGLVQPGELAASTGGRAPRELIFGARAGHLLVASLGASYIRAALTDLAGGVVARRLEPADIGRGPEEILAQVSAIFNGLLSETDARLWGIGVGVPGPVEFSSGSPVAPPIMPGWDGWNIREHFETRYGVPTWIDNDVNLMMLGELRAGAARGQPDAVFVKVGSGIGAGLISHGRMHRGAQGCAGDIGHIEAETNSDVVCRCGNRGCLEALAGGAAIVRSAIAAGREGRSPMLAEALRSRTDIRPIDVVRYAQRGDDTSRQLLRASARMVGSVLAQIVNIFNPSLVLLGGQVAAEGHDYLAQVRQTVLARSLPLSTKSLQIIPSRLGDAAGLIGAAYMVTDELLSRHNLPAWIDDHPRALIPQLAKTA